MSVVCDLIHQTKPASNVCNVLWYRKFSDSVEVFWQRLHDRFGNTKACKIDRSFSELKLVGIEDNAGLSKKGEKFDGSPPMLLESVIVKNCTVNAAFLAFKICVNGIKAKIITVTRRQETLWRSCVSPFSKWCYERCKVAVGFTQRDTMIAIPCVSYCFPCASWNSASKLKWCL